MVKSLINILVLGLFVALLGMACDSTIEKEIAALKPTPIKEKNIDSAQSSNEGLKMTTPKQYDSAPEMSIDVAKKYTAKFQLDGGKGFVVELYPEVAPITVNSFVFLAKEGYFDNTTFHRVISGFMSQGGDPTGTGMGGLAIHSKMSFIQTINMILLVSCQWPTQALEMDKLRTEANSL